MFHRTTTIICYPVRARSTVFPDDSRFAFYFRKIRKPIIAATVRLAPARDIYYKINTASRKYSQLHPATFFSSRPRTVRRAVPVNFRLRRHDIAIHDSFFFLLPSLFSFCSEKTVYIYHEIRFLITLLKYIR